MRGTVEEERDYNKREGIIMMGGTIEEMEVTINDDRQ